MSLGANTQAHLEMKQITDPTAGFVTELKSRPLRKQAWPLRFSGRSLKAEVLGFLVPALLLAGGCKKPSPEPAIAPTNSSVPATAQTNAPPGNGHTLVLNAETQKRMGLTTFVLTKTPFDREVKGYGRVMDPSTLVALAGELASAQSALTASQREHERLKSLYARDQSASLRALQAAETTLQHDQIQMDMLQARLRLSWGESLFHRPDGPVLLQSLSRLEAVLVRLEVPAGEAPPEPPASARLVGMNAEDRPIEVRFLDRVTAVNPQTQGQGYLFLATTNALRWLPGTAVVGYLKLPGPPREGVVVPRAAIVRHEGKTWIYVKTAGERFQRREIGLDQPREEGWLVSAGAAAQDEVVVIGAQMLLSEELKSQIPAED